ncbi:MAG: CDP-alcohol phosphatidyltransferase family protein, partial [Gemmatimonadota bacterium]|nr:CDP-alcohol phosphatidyltransferase family protein [Gemmatimonadota bacterium]
MVDSLVRAPKDRLLGPLAYLLGHVVYPNAVTIAAWFMGLVAAIAAARGWFGCALALWIANRLLDGIDGTLART